jgi:superfamily II DNA or RNA helicase
MAGDSTPKQTIQRMGRVLRRKKTDSILYQVYCKGTIEEEQAWDRAKLFKELASQYADFTYELDKDLILIE